MTFSEYVLHYISFPQAIIYFALSMVLLLAMLFVILVYSKGSTAGMSERERREAWRQRAHSYKERMYELIFSGTSIVSFLTTYYLIERFLPAGTLRTFWENYRDWLLLVLVVLSCLLNSAFDRYMVRLKYLDREECSYGRVTGMLYVLIIFFYIKFVYEDANYDRYIIYFLGLMVGRFVYFDASFHDFAGIIRQAARNLPLMAMSLGYLGLMCLFGFHSEYLIVHIGVITNVWITQLFMCISVFIMSRFHLFDRQILGKRTQRKSAAEEEVEEIDYFD